MTEALHGIVRHLTAVLGAAVLALLVIAATTTSPAVAAPAGGGWEYVTNTADVTAWKWSNGSWSQSTMKPGQPVWSYPWTATWTWAHKEGSWYAVQSKYLRTWACTGAGSTIKLHHNEPMYRWNTTKSQFLGVVAADVEVKRLCGSTFLDAFAGPEAVTCDALGCGPENYILVRATPQPVCAFAEPACAVDPLPGATLEKVGYIVEDRPRFDDPLFPWE